MPMPSMRRLAATAAAVLLAAGLSTATPAAATGLFGDGPIELQAGGLVFATPKYEGSKEYEAMAVPFIAPAGLGEGGLVQFRGPDDLRLRLFKFGGFEAGPLAGWRFDREESDSRRLTGLGDVDGGLVVGGFAAYRFQGITPFVTYNHQVTGDETGGLLRFGAEVPVALMRGIKLTGTIGTTWADDDYMDAYFSVRTPTARLAAYDAEAGLKDVHLGLSADIPVADRWTLKVMGRYARLLGDAADSPIVESEDQFMGGLGLTYRFSIDR